MKKRRDFTLYRRLYEFARPYRLQILAILLVQLLATPLLLLTPVPLKIAVDTVISGRPLAPWLGRILPAAFPRGGNSLLLFAAVLFVITALLTGLQALASWLLQTYTGEKLVQDFRAALFHHVQRLSLSYHDTQGTTDSTYRIQYDAPSIQYIVVSGLIPIMAAVTMLAGMIYVTARIDAYLAVVALGVAPILFAVTRIFGPRIRREWRKIKHLDSSAMNVVQEVLSSVRVVKAFGREEHEQQRFVRRSSERMWGQIRVAVLQGGFDLAVAFLIAVGTALTLFVGVLRVKAGILTVGDLLLVMAYVAQLNEPLKTLSKKITDLQSGLASAERAFALLDEAPEVVTRPDARSLARSAGAVKFVNVSFAYGAGQPVLQNISFDVEPGTTVGIQGTTGAGKTTLMGLLTRFYDPTGGAILLDGVDLRDYNLKDLRDQFAIVLQDPVLFSSSIAENIAYARPAATMDQITEAARYANAYDFIMRLPDGFDTKVGERGMRLSGGERQRISLARAFLKNAPILILDEPTSSVDVQTEAAIIDAMERLMRGRTSFMIAHRLSTLSACDVRLRIEGGRLVSNRLATA